MGCAELPVTALEDSAVEDSTCVAKRLVEEVAAFEGRGLLPNEEVS